MTLPARFLVCAAFGLAAFVTPGPAQSITEFPLPTAGSTPSQITAGPDGNLWFTEYTYNSALGIVTAAAIGRVSTTGTFTEFVLPNSNGFPGGITHGPDGNLWFTQTESEFNTLSLIGRITPAGAITVFPTPRPWDNPWDITAGPDGNLWFTEASPNPNSIGRITTTGTITEFPRQTGGYPIGIASGPDGNVWFTALEKVGRITPTGVVTEFPLPPPFRAPSAITAGPDGNLWFTEPTSNRIGRITPAGVITEFLVPTPSAGLADITAGPDGNLWFTESNANKIGRITRFGFISEYPIPTPGSGPRGIASGPDDAIWFTETTGNKIGRITTGVVTDPAQILPVVGSTAGIAGSFFRTSVQLHNAGATPSAGGIVFHRSGVSGSISDPTLFFTLAPGETRTIPDLLPAMDLSGLGSADVVLTLGSAGNVPIVSARVFNDAGTGGTTGFALNAMTAQGALRPGQRGILTIPADLANFRMNVGVRTLAADVSMTLTVRDAGGALVASIPKFFPATYHEQQSATVFLNGLSLPPGGSITALVEAGSVIVYGATVDNRTGDPSLQVAAPAP